MQVGEYSVVLDLSRESGGVGVPVPLLPQVFVSCKAAVQGHPVLQDEGGIPVVRVRRRPVGSFRYPEFRSCRPPGAGSAEDPFSANIRA